MTSLVLARVAARTRARGSAGRPLTSLVLPAYNPGPAVERTWHAAREFVHARPEPWELVFVCDGCTDDTPARLARLVGRDPTVEVLDYSPNRGKGFAVRTGLLAARGAYRLFTDIDLAYRFEDVLRLAEALWVGAEVAIASREHPESTVQLPARLLGYAYRRRLQSRLFGAVARRLLPITHRDTQAGLKGMTAAVAEQILPALRCNGFGFDCELLTACAWAGIRVTEVPVSVRYDEAASTTGAGSALRMLRELWRIRRSWRRGWPVTVAIPQTQTV